MTVLFADLSGYTAVAERMDPEAVKALVDRVLMRLGEEVERYGGTVDKYIGDNVMAIFGAPVAHEDDEERAVRAGLGMQAAMGEVNEDLPDGVHFDLRVGVNTGEVLAGRGGRGLHGGRRHGQRRRPPAERGAPGQRHRRRAHHARVERRRPLRAARAARAEGQVRARPRLGGRGGPRAPRGRPRRAPSRETPLVGRDAGAVHARDDLRARRAGARAAPGDAGRRGRRGQVARAARAGDASSAARAVAPTFRTGRCLPYGSGIVFWALGEVLRQECGIVDSDSAEEAWVEAARVRARPVRRQGRGGDARRPSARPR